MMYSRLYGVWPYPSVRLSVCPRLSYNIVWCPSDSQALHKNSALSDEFYAINRNILTSEFHAPYPIIIVRCDGCLKEAFLAPSSSEDLKQSIRLLRFQARTTTFYSLFGNFSFVLLTVSIKTRKTDQSRLRRHSIGL